MKKFVAVVGALVLGAGISLAGAVSASATHPTVTGVAVCNTATGLFDIMWTVGGDLGYPNETATVKVQSVATSPTFVGVSVKGSQKVSAPQAGVSAGTYSLTVKVQWTNHREGDLVSKTGNVTVSGSCEVPVKVVTVQPSVDHNDECGADNLVVNVPEDSEGVVWSSTVTPSKVEVTAAATAGYVLTINGVDTAATFSWVFEDSGEVCPPVITDPPPTVVDPPEELAYTGSVAEPLVPLAGGLLLLGVGVFMLRTSYAHVD